MMRKHLAFIGVLSLFVTILPLSAYAEEESVIPAEYHTPEEIKEFIDTHPVSYETTYDVMPSYHSPYEPGKLSDETLQSALNMLNTIRYIAGLSYDVTLNEVYTEQVQAGTMLDAAVGTLTHTPSKPDDMSDELYELAYSGTSSSNLAWGYGSLPEAIRHGWLEDGDSFNIDRVGHRRWLLNPTMKATGFGKTASFTGIYAFDGCFQSTDQVSVWPAQNTPLDFFGSVYPWTYSTGTEETGDVEVILKRDNTDEEWRFNKDASDGYFNINNDGYGLTGCVIFRPNDISYNAGDTFQVSIKNLQDGDVSYTVHFFDLSQVGKEPIQDDYMGWQEEDGKSYWYEKGERQGVETDPKCFWFEGTLRGREIYDPESDGWYWLDVNANGAKAINKEVFMPYIYQDEAEHLNDEAWINSVAILSKRTTPNVIDLSQQVRIAILNHDTFNAGKWVRYNAEGKMIKGWYTVEGSDIDIYPDQAGNTYYYDDQTGLMAKGYVSIDGKVHHFDEVTGVMQW